MVTKHELASQKFQREREGLLDELFLQSSGLTWCHRMTDCADRLLGSIFEETHERFPDLTQLAIVATGGYGRRELSPYSDIDLTVIPLDESDRNLDPAIRYLFNRIHTAFGLVGIDVGYNYRLLADVPALDAKTRTGIIDSRFVAGNLSPFENLIEEFWRTFPVGEFLVAKIEERNAMLRKYNDSPLVVEPHLKEGAGGLRCFQVSNWLRSAIGLRPIPATKSYEKVIETRNYLHAVSMRKFDLLNRARQGEISERLGMHPNQLLADVTRSLEEGEAQLAETMKSLHEARYPLSASVSAIRGEARIVANAPLSDAAFGIAMATRLGLRIESRGPSFSSDIRGSQSLVALSRGESTVRRLDESGVLEHMLPEFTSLRYVMPSDISHSHSVFEHTLRALRVLDRINPGHGFFGVLKESIREHGPLVLAILLHDAGKPISEAQHSQAGSQIAEKVCVRWGLDHATRDLICWLIQEHLTMASMARLRDVYHPSTAEELARIAQTPNRLAHLTLLTYVDAMAVGENNWTSAQESFLKELYDRTLDRLEGNVAPEINQSARTKIAKKISKKELGEKDVTTFVSQLPAHYLLSTPESVIQEHMVHSLAAVAGEITVEVHNQRETELSEITICCIDKPGLLSKALGVFYAVDLSLVSLRACTTSSDPPVVIDVFTMAHGGRSIPASSATKIATVLPQILSGELDLDEFIICAGKDPDKKQIIHEFNFIPGDPGILEVRAPRARGLAYRLSRIIAQQGWNIVSARGSQWAGMGVATFYLVDRNHKPLNKAQVNEIFGRLV